MVSVSRIFVGPDSTSCTVSPSGLHERASSVFNLRLDFAIMNEFLLRSSSYLISLVDYLVKKNASADEDDRAFFFQTKACMNKCV